MLHRHQDDPPQENIGSLGIGCTDSSSCNVWIMIPGNTATRNNLCHDGNDIISDGPPELIEFSLTSEHVAKADGVAASFSVGFK